MTPRKDSAARTSRSISDGRGWPDSGTSVLEGEEGGVYYASHDPAEDGLATTVTLAVAAVADVPPTDLLPPITEIVDTDGLNRLFQPAANSDVTGASHLVLEIEGHEVRIEADGTIAITPLTDENC